MHATDGFYLRQFLGVLRRRAWIVVQAVLILAAAAVLLSLRATTEYEATSVLLVGGTKAPLADLNVADDKLTSTTAARLIRTREVGERVRKALGSELGVDELLGRISTAGDSDGFATVTARGGSGAEAALIANAFARQFVALRAETPYVGLRKTVRAIQRQLRKTQTSGPEREALLSQLAQLNTLAAVPTADAEVVDPAVAPTAAASPTPVRDGVIGAALGLLLGLAIVLLLEALDPRLRAFDELRRLVAAPQLAGVPVQLFRRPSRFRPRLRSEPRVAAAARRFPAAFERLRTSLLVFNAEQELKTILVASPHDEREGKTTIAASLAVSLAKVGLKVCVVDADLRKPRLARHFGFSEHALGLVDVVERGANLKNVIQRFRVPGAPAFLTGNGNGNGSRPGSQAEIGVLTAGSRTNHPAEVVASKPMHELVDELEQDFDVVIVDCAPLVEASDALPLIARASGTVLVVRLFHTPRNSVAQAASVIAGARGTIVGVVATGVPPRELREEGHGAWAAAQAQAPSRVLS